MTIQVQPANGLISMNFDCYNFYTTLGFQAGLSEDCLVLDSPAMTNCANQRIPGLRYRVRSMIGIKVHARATG